MSLNQVDEKMVQDADEYIKKHRLIELFEVINHNIESSNCCCIH
jgi:hypothetical protein